MPSVVADSSPDSTPSLAVSARDPAAALTHAILLVITVAAWVQVLSSAMRTSDMRGMHMAIPPTVLNGLLYVGAWAAMMAAMILPSASPMIGLYAATWAEVPT